MLTKLMVTLKCVFERLGKILCVFLVVIATIILIETIKEKYNNAPKNCTETATDEFGLGVRPNMNGKITFGFGSDDSGFNLMDVFSFED